MIAYLRGTVLEREGGTVVLEVGGVGYEVALSGHSLSEVGPVGSPLAVRVYTQIQDTRIGLFGFVSAEERALFDLLITVKHVGPTSAIKILSAGAGPRDIASLIARGQVATIQRLRGVGKKTAELLVVELRDKCEVLLQRWGEPADSAAAAGADHRAVGLGSIQSHPPVVEDVVSALGQLGWRSAEVDRAVAQLDPGPDATFAELLREALRQMPR